MRFCILKTLIINGSPRKNGDTSELIEELKKQLNSDFIEISAYYDKISTCKDCRQCWKKKTNIKYSQIEQKNIFL